MASRRLLKRDGLGMISVCVTPAGVFIERDCRAVAAPVRWLAARLQRREAAALERLAGVGGIPALLRSEPGRLTRTYLAGAPMHRAQPPGADYFRHAHRLLRQVHRAGVAHNDLAKEANWLCLDDGDCGIVDFQLAFVARRRGRWFRMLAREDLRHLLKHKRRYVPAALTARERALLARPSLAARLWRRLVKPPYRWLTRGLLGWPERSDAEERGALPPRRDSADGGGQV